MVTQWLAFDRLTEPIQRTWRRWTFTYDQPVEGNIFSFYIFKAEQKIYHMSLIMKKNDKVSNYITTTATTQRDHSPTKKAKNLQGNNPNIRLCLDRRKHMVGQRDLHCEIFAFLSFQIAKQTSIFKELYVFLFAPDCPSVRILLLSRMDLGI